MDDRNRSGRNCQKASGEISENSQMQGEKWKSNTEQKADYGFIATLNNTGATGNVPIAESYTIIGMK
jgi:hypothetical protein